MEIPAGFKSDDGQEQTQVLKLNKSLYGLKVCASSTPLTLFSSQETAKQCSRSARNTTPPFPPPLYLQQQAGLNWYEKLRDGLMDRDFVPSQIDPCLYLKDGMAVLTYVDDCIIVGKSTKAIDALIHSLQNGQEGFNLTDKGNIDKFLGVEITNRANGEFEMSQPHLISRIVAFLGLKALGVSRSNIVIESQHHLSSLTRIWKESHAKYLGSIELLLVCSYTFRQILGKTLPWQPSKQPASPSNQNYLTNKPLIGLVSISAAR